MAEEIWKQVKGYDFPYEVSNFGRFRGPGGIGYGYDSGIAIMVRVMRQGKPLQVRLHTLVAQAFVPNPDAMIMVRHKDGNIMNCRAENLEWYSGKKAVKEETPAPAPQQNVPVCPKDCIHLGFWEHDVTCCDYIFNVGKPRPCPAGPDCTEYEAGKRIRKKHGQWDF